MMPRNRQPQSGAPAWCRWPLRSPLWSVWSCGRSLRFLPVPQSVSSQQTWMRPTQYLATCVWSRCRARRVWTGETPGSSWSVWVLPHSSMQAFSGTQASRAPCSWSSAPATHRRTWTGRAGQTSRRPPHHQAHWVMGTPSGCRTLHRLHRTM